MLGEQTALALALLVAADVLDTVMKPSHAFEMNDVIKMGFLTVLRTGVAYFLAREIKELEMGGGHSSHGRMDDMVDNDTIYRRRGQNRRSGNNLTLVRCNSSKMKIQGKESDKTTNSYNSNNSGDFELSYEEYVDGEDNDFEETYDIAEERPASLRFRGRPSSSSKVRSSNSKSINSRHRKSNAELVGGSGRKPSSTSQLHEE